MILGLDRHAGLPGSCPAGQQVASLQSPPPKAFGLMTLQTSYSTWANTMLCLLAAKAGSADCTKDLINDPRADQSKAGLVSNGGPPVSPARVAAWARVPAGQTLERVQPA